MLQKELEKIAEKYLQEQAEIISKYGAAPRLKGDKYEEALADIKRAFELICSPK
jgi:hypothetical protein